MRNNFGHVSPSALTIGLIAAVCIVLHFFISLNPADGSPAWKSATSLQQVTAEARTSPLDREVPPISRRVERPERIAYITPDEEDRLLAEQIAEETHVMEEPVSRAPQAIEEPLPVTTCEDQGLITAEDGSCVPASFYDEPSTDWTEGYAPCASEDSDGPCYWDASTMGNGQGRSFIVTAAQEVIYQ